MTRKLFEHTSETHDAQNPSKADRANDKSKSSDADTCGNASLTKLYVKNQGKCPAAVAAADATAP